MKRLKAVLAPLLALCLLAGCAPRPAEVGEQKPPPSAAPSASAAQASAPVDESENRENALACLYYDQAVYEAAQKAAEPYAVTGQVLAGIVPHHGTASKMIASFYGALTESYDAVIIIGPNHYTKLGGVVYSDCAWKTAYGDLPGDEAFASLLDKDQDIRAIRSSETVQADHAVGWQLPFAADYLGDVKIVGILLSGLASQKQLSSLAALIADYAESKKVLIIGSVDFSHYLMPEAAKAQDEKTKEIIDQGDYGRLLALDSDNMDSPETVYVIMKALKAMGGGGLTLLDQSISYEQAGGEARDVDPGEGTTTYLIYASVKNGEDKQAAATP